MTEKAGLKVSGSSQSMEAVTADEKLAELLKVKSGDRCIFMAHLSR